MSSGGAVALGGARGEFLPDDGYFTSPLQPWGQISLTLGIGPLGMRLEGLSRGQASQLEQRFHPFVVEGAAGRRLDPEVRVSVRRAGVSHFLRTREDGFVETYRMESRVEDARVTLWSYEFAGWVEPPRRLAQVALVQEQGHLFERGLENFLRVVTALFILDRGGFLFHASAVVRKGRAYVFFGPSGSGKTTVTHLSPEDQVLSDDLTLVVPHAGRFEAAGIPFGLSHHRVPETCFSLPVASLNRLVKSQAVRREPLNRARALAEVVSSLPFVMQETDRAERAIEVAARALESIPVYRLYFRKDASFWNVVEER